MIYHIFNYRIQGKWYRDSATYSEAQFERIMEALDWKLPVHMQIYHYGSPDRKYYDLTNAIVVKRPVLSLDPMALAVSPQEKRTSVYDKQREISWPVVHRLGRFLICQPDDDWPRFCYADGDRFSLITPMDITPVSIKEAMEFVRQNHRHCSAPQGHKFSIGLVAGDGARIGVAIASIPKARALNDGRYHSCREGDGIPSVCDLYAAAGIRKQFAGSRVPAGWAHIGPAIGVELP